MCSTALIQKSGAIVFGPETGSNPRVLPLESNRRSLVFRLIVFDGLSEIMEASTSKDFN